MKKPIIPILFLLLLLPAACLQAQEKTDTLENSGNKKARPYADPIHWNVIKFNPTPMLIFGNLRNITLSYERLLGKNQSVSIQVGYLLLPRLVDDTIGNRISISGRSKNGVNLSLDYRYYPWSRNRRPAPDGLYIGAYASYYGFQFRNNFDILNTTVDQNGTMKGRINVLNVGLMLGYQFIFWKRFSIDLLMFGPSVSSYSGNFTISGSLDPEEIKNLDQEMVDKLLNRFPLLKSIFSSEGLSFTGSRTSLSVGFRYSVQFGIHF